MRSWPRSGSTKENYEQRIDIETSLQARAKASQGRLAEAEADIRGALLSRLRANGKYAVTTANQIAALSAEIAALIKSWDAKRRQLFDLDGSVELGSFGMALLQGTQRGQAPEAGKDRLPVQCHPNHSLDVQAGPLKLLGLRVASLK
jgi:hypothetical protein